MVLAGQPCFPPIVGVNSRIPPTDFPLWSSYAGSPRASRGHILRIKDGHWRSVGTRPPGRLGWERFGAPLLTELAVTTAK